MHVACDERNVVVEAACPVCQRRAVQTTSGDGDAGGSEAVSQAAFALRVADREQDPQRRPLVVFFRLANQRRLLLRPSLCGAVRGE